MSAELGAAIDVDERSFEMGLEHMRLLIDGLSHHNQYLTVLKSLVVEPSLDRDKACSLLAFAVVLLIEERAKGGAR